MVVEDEWLIRELIVDVLTDAGFETIEAATADSAALLLDIKPLRLIVTDINLGGNLDGIALAKIARDRTPDIPVLFVSGRPNKLDEARVLGHPVAFLPKPFRLDQLVANVQQLVDA
jgi:DNA-binding response OmpR family regulator